MKRRNMPARGAEGRLDDLARYSVQLIESLQDASGAYPAAPSFSAYKGFSWFRDGSFIADSMSSAGHHKSAERFFDWCAMEIARNQGVIEHHFKAHLEGFKFDRDQALPTRYAFTATDEPDEPWPDHQIDGYGTWMWALVSHHRRLEADLANYGSAINLSTKYLIASWSSPCYDWWEENGDKIHISTLGCVLAGLHAAISSLQLEPRVATLAAEAADAISSRLMSACTNGYLPKWEGSEDVDSSVLALLAPLELFDPSDEIYERTIIEIQDRLISGLGLHRFATDTYFGGGLWPLLSCYLALAKLRQGDPSFAESLLEWMADISDEEGNMPEQINTDLVDPQTERYWIDRWGPSASPLLWAHAMFLKVKTDLERHSHS